jgi:hypothetical protein
MFTVWFDAIKKWRYYTDSFYVLAIPIIELFANRSVTPPGAGIENA